LIEVFGLLDLQEKQGMWNVAVVLELVGSSFEFVGNSLELDGNSFEVVDGSLEDVNSS